MCLGMNQLDTFSRMVYWILDEQEGKVESQQAAHHRM